MSNYKTELQSNNTDLQSIINQIDELGTIVTEQDGIIAQIHSALRGSGGTTVDDIGVFTCSDTGDIQHLFIKGMTFGEWVDSSMNVGFYDENKCIKNFKLSDGKIYLFESITGGEIYNGALSTDGANLVAPDTIIEEISYSLVSAEPF